MAELTEREALEALNELRSNVICTQRATWSNMMYPLVAILEAAGFELNENPTDDQVANHLFDYGGAGGFPGHEKEEPGRERNEPGYQARVTARTVRERNEKRRAQMRGE